MMLRDADMSMFRHWSVMMALSRVRALSIMNTKDVEYRYALGEVHTWMRQLAKLYDVPLERLQQIFTDAADLTYEAGAEHILQSLRDHWRPTA